MQGGNAVDESRVLHGGHGHGKILLVVFGVNAAAGQEIVQRDVELAQVIAEIVFQHVGAEDIVGGLDVGVGGEHARLAHHFHGLGEDEALVLHQHPGPLEGGERRMALVHVHDRDLDAEGVEHFHAADAQDDLLLQAHLGIAAVELGGEPAVVLAVLFMVGIEHVDGDPADLDLPDLEHDLAAGEIQFDLQRAAVGLASPPGPACCENR